MTDRSPAQDGLSTPLARLSERGSIFPALLRLGNEAALLVPRRRVRSLSTLARCPAVEVPKTATRESFGTVSLRSSRRFPLISGARVDNPVMFPPGRARLATKPFPTGSSSCAITMGIVSVASLAVRVAAGPAVTMTSTLRRTSSAASAGRRRAFPPRIDTQ